MTFVRDHPWNAVDRTTLMQFLASDTGVKLLELIEIEAPRPREPLATATFENSALQSQRYFGWLDVKEYIERLLMVSPEQVASVEWYTEKETDPRKLEPNPL